MISPHHFHPTNGVSPVDSNEEDAAVVEILTNTPVELSHLDLQVRPKKGL